MVYPVSSRWYQTLTNSHNIAVKFEVLDGSLSNILYKSPVFVSGIPQPSISQPVITGGKVTMDKQSNVRSQFDLQLSDPTGILVPLTRVDPLTPWGNIIRVYRGLAYPDGTTELPRLGTFRITDSETKDSKGAVVINVSGQGLSRIGSRAKVVNFYQSALSTNYTDVIRKMALDSYPGVRFDHSAANWRLIPPAGLGANGSNQVLTDALVPLIYQEGADLWSEMQKLAHALSCDLFFNRDGVLVLRRDPNLDYHNGNLSTLPPPVAKFEEGSQARFIDLARKLSDGNSYNQWIITGEGQVIGASLSPFRSAPARDTDPNSPTYINGQYGVVAGFETNDLMKTQAQIDSYAQWKLKTSIGGQELVQFNGFVDTALDVDDVISVTRKRMGLVNVLYVIDALTFPLLAKDTMSVRLRERRAIV